MDVVRKRDTAHNSRRVLSPAAIKFYHDIHNTNHPNHTHEPRTPDAGGNEVPMKTLSTIAKENATKQQIKLSMHKMKMHHVAAKARYIQQVTGVNVTEHLKKHGIDLD